MTAPGLDPGVDPAIYSVTMVRGWLGMNPTVTREGTCGSWSPCC